MLRPFRPLVAVLLVVAAAQGSMPAARTVTLAAPTATVAAIARAIEEQTGTALDVSAADATKVIPASFDRVDFWKAVESVADRTGTHIVSAGGKTALKPGKSAAPSFVSGPFRFAAREVLVRGDLGGGPATYDVAVDVCWEPWLNAYRIDTSPTIDRAADDASKPLTFPPAAARTFTSGTVAALAVRPRGLSRASKSFSLAGSIRVTVADELLTFTFDATTGQATAPATHSGVSAVVKKFGPDGPDWAAEIELRYPKSDVTWESNEDYWPRGNRLRLIPTTGDPITAELDNLDLPVIRYAVKGGAKKLGKGWKLEYRTPGPMREIVVPFELKNLALP